MLAARVGQTGPALSSASLQLLLKCCNGGGRTWYRTVLSSFSSMNLKLLRAFRLAELYNPTGTAPAGLTCCSWKVSHWGFNHHKWRGLNFSSHLKYSGLNSRPSFLQNAINSSAPFPTALDCSCYGCSNSAWLSSGPRKIIVPAAGHGTDVAHTGHTDHWRCKTQAQTSSNNLCFPYQRLQLVSGQAAGLVLKATASHPYGITPGRSRRWVGVCLTHPSASAQHRGTKNTHEELSLGSSCENECLYEGKTPSIDGPFIKLRFTLRFWKSQCFSLAHFKL